VNPLWHEPEGEAKGVLVLTHGAGSNADVPLLIAVAQEFARAGYGVLRHNLAFRQERPRGSPSRSSAGRDRAGLEAAVETVRGRGRVLLGGHSYGGRQASMLAAEKPGLADALLLLSYPLHPPQKPAELRTAHFPQLRTPALFVHGSRDPFGSLEEMRAAIALIPARTELMEIEKAGHDLKKFAWTPRVPATLAALLE
jgi:uncharacterized protein